MSKSELKTNYLKNAKTGYTFQVKILIFFFSPPPPPRYQQARFPNLTPPLFLAPSATFFWDSWQVSMYQTVILLQYNTATVYTWAELTNNTGLSKDSLFGGLAILLKAKVLTSEG